MHVMYERLIYDDLLNIYRDEGITHSNEYLLQINKENLIL